METNEKEGKKKSPLILIVIIVVVLVGLGAGAYFLFFADSGPTMADEFYYFPDDAFVTNIEGSSTLIKVSITLGTSRDMSKELPSKCAVIRDAILDILRKTTADVYKSEDAQTYLSEKICAFLNDYFMPYEKDQTVPLFTKAYITDLVMQ